MSSYLIYIHIDSIENLEKAQMSIDKMVEFFSYNRNDLSFFTDIKNGFLVYQDLASSAIACCDQNFTEKANSKDSYIKALWQHDKKTPQEISRYIIKFNLSEEILNEYYTAKNFGLLKNAIIGKRVDKLQIDNALWKIGEFVEVKNNEQKKKFWGWW